MAWSLGSPLSPSSSANIFPHSKLFLSRIQVFQADSMRLLFPLFICKGFLTCLQIRLSQTLVPSIFASKFQLFLSPVSFTFSLYKTFPSQTELDQICVLCISDCFSFFSSFWVSNSWPTQVKRETLCFSRHLIARVYHAPLLHFFVFYLSIKQISCFFQIYNSHLNAVLFNMIFFQKNWYKYLYLYNHNKILSKIY